MKHTNLKATILICFVIIGITSCNSPKQKAKNLENAEQNVVTAKDELDKAVLDSTKEYRQYKAESDAKLEAIDTEIASLQAKLAAENEKRQTDYERKLNDLELKNAKLKASMKAYKEGNKTDWEKFKTNFNHDLDELGKSLSKLSKGSN